MGRDEGGKTDMERVGLFSEVGYTTIGDKYPKVKFLPIFTIFFLQFFYDCCKTTHFRSTPDRVHSIMQRIKRNRCCQGEVKQGEFTLRYIQYVTYFTELWRRFFATVSGKIIEKVA